MMSVPFDELKQLLSMLKRQREQITALQEAGTRLVKQRQRMRDPERIVQIASTATDHGTADATYFGVVRALRTLAADEVI